MKTIPSTITPKPKKIKADKPVHPEQIFLRPEVRIIHWMTKTYKAERLKVEIDEGGKKSRYSVFAFAYVLRRKKIGIETSNQIVKVNEVVPIILRDGSLELLYDYVDNDKIRLVDEKLENVGGARPVLGDTRARYGIPAF